MQLTPVQYQNLIRIDSKCLNQMFANQTIKDVQARINEGLKLSDQREGEKLTKEQKDNVLLAERLELLNML